ncbi:hypothetical protein BIW11_07382, partial [Tropilaelaps mercedesae]
MAFVIMCFLPTKLDANKFSIYNYGINYILGISLLPQICHVETRTVPPGRIVQTTLFSMSIPGM